MPLSHAAENRDRSCHPSVLQWTRWMLATIALTFASGAPICVAEESSNPPEALTRERLRTSLYGTGFTIWLDDPVIDQLLEIQNHLTAKEYVKAFRLIDERRKVFQDRLVPWNRGLYLTAEKYFWRQLVELPPAGREAFRLYFEARAAKLADQWENVGHDEAELIANEVYHAYFLTSVGDNAANRLGDAAFRRGHFHRAAEFWQSILQYSPDSELSELRLRVKRTVALHRAGRTNQRDEELATIASRFAGEEIVIAGKPVLATEYLANLPAAPKAELTQVEEPPPLPTKSQWKWRTSRNNPTIGSAQMIGKLVMVHEGNRIAAYDETGQDRWGRRGGNFLNKIQNFLGFGNNIAPALVFDEPAAEAVEVVEEAAPAPAVEVAGDDAPRLEVDADGNEDAAEAFPAIATPYGGEETPVEVDEFVFDNGRLFTCLKTEQTVSLHSVHLETGNSLWVAKMPNYRLASSPAVGNGMVFVVAFRGANDMYLNAVDDSTGTLRWSTKLGSARSADNNGSATRNRAQLLCDDRHVFVMTNEGAMVSVEIATGSIAWMCKTTPKPMADNSGYGSWTAPSRQGGMFLSGSTLIYKESGASEVHFFDTESQRLLRSRRVMDDARLVGVDGSTLWLLRDNELEAINWQKNEMLWALSIATLGDDILIGKTRLLAPTNRGIFEIDRQSGDVRQITRDSEMAYGGGKLFAHQGQLYNVNYRSVRAYFPNEVAGDTVPRGDP